MGAARNRSTIRALSGLAIAAALASCGGGGSSGGSGGGGGAPPIGGTPTPTPTPAPTPVFVTAGHVALGEIRFYLNGASPPSPDYAQVSSDRQGRYPRVVGQPLFFGSGPNAVPANYAAIAKLGFGIDSAGSFYFSYPAAPDITVLSPVTVLLTGGVPEAKLETQLGMTGSVFQLSADRDLKTFPPTEALASNDAALVAEAERLFAHHLRVDMLTASLNEFRPAEQDPTGLGTFLGSLSPATGELSLAVGLNAAPAQFLFTNERMTALLGSYPAIASAGYRPEVVSGAAHLINAYAALISTRVASRERAAQLKIGIKGYLIPEIKRLLRANSVAAANEALGVTTAQMETQIARYAEQLPFDPNDNFFPSPDFYSIAPGGSKLVDATDVGSNGDGPFNSNDLHSEPRLNDGGHFFRGESQLTAVTVPAVNAAQIGATLNPDGTVLIRPATGFTGVTWFDYTVRHARGDVEQGRVYVRVS